MLPCGTRPSGAAVCPKEEVFLNDRGFSWQDVESGARDLLRNFGESGNQEYHFEILMSALRLARDEPARIDLKIVNSALKELRYSFKLFSAYRGQRKVAVFGSARTAPADDLYRLGEATGALAVEQGMLVITGAGPGVMEAANKGAGPAGGFGLAIRLPFEPEANPFVRRPDRLINFKYFFTRKLIFIKESDAFVLFPGGFGTNDECFELLTLLQTGKCEPRPVVLIDLPGGTYWNTWMEFVKRELVGRGMIDDDDLQLLTLARSPEEALAEIHRFYRVYHSSRFVGDRLMLRLQKELSQTELDQLQAEFPDLISERSLERCPLLEEDAQDPLLANLFPIWFRFDRRRFSRLRVLIDAINRV